MKFKTYRQLELKPRILGVPISELKIVMVAFMLFVLIGGLLMVLNIYSRIYFLVVVLLFLCSFPILRRLNKKNHPTFIMSLISFRLNQPKRISVVSSKIKLAKLSDARKR